MRVSSRARRSFSSDRAGLNGVPVASPCRGSTPTNPRPLESNSPAEAHGLTWQTWSRVHVRKNLDLVIRRIYKPTGLFINLQDCEDESLGHLASTRVVANGAGER